jgi:hypothetical protein
MNDEHLSQARSTGSSGSTAHVDTDTTMSASGRTLSAPSGTDRLPLPVVLTLLGLVAGAAYWAGGTREKVENTRQPPAIQAPPSTTPVSPPVAPDRRAGVSAVISSPRAGSQVDPVMVVTGQVEGAPDGWDVWLLTRREVDGYVFPKKRVTLAGDGRFEKRIWDHGASGPLWVCILVVEPSETRRFDAWQREGDRTHVYPALVLDDAKSRLLTCQELVLNNPSH